MWRPVGKHLTEHVSILLVIDRRVLYPNVYCKVRVEGMFADVRLMWCFVAIVFSSCLLYCVLLSSSSSSWILFKMLHTSQIVVENMYVIIMSSIIGRQ